jgi:hypothetical protein
MTAHSAGSDGTTYDPNDDWPDKAKGAPEPAPNLEDMRAHLELLFGGDRCAGMLDGQVEISWTDIYGNVKYAEMFGLDELDEAAEYGAKQNRKRGVNVFVSAALRTKDAPPGKRAGKEFVLGMTAVPVDWDLPGEGDPASVREKTAFLPQNFVVVTGKHPHFRSHGWWVLDEPLMGVAAIEALMKPMAHSLKGDTGVINADRVMRLAGTQAWAHKPGRIREQTYLVTRFKADGDKPRPPSYNTDRVVRTFQARWAEEPAGDGPAGSATGDADDKNPFTGRFDPAALIAKIKAGQWHDGMLKLAAHTVGMGYPDWLLELAFDQFDDKTVPHKERPMDLVRQARVRFNKPNPADPSDEFDFSQSPPKPLEPESAEDIVLENIRRRPWLFGSWLLKGYLTMLIGTGGQGKSMLAIHVALAVASGMAWAGQKVRESGGVWIWNNEDDRDELHRRIGGTAKHMGIDLKNLGGNRLFANSGVDDGSGNACKLIVATAGDHNSVIATPHVEDVVRHIKANGIKLLIVDPFVSTHSLNENDNPQMEAVTFLYRQIAYQADCAVMLVHHTSKPGDTDQAGNQHASRGASSITAAARVVLTVAPMSDADAKKVMGEDYPEREREHCIRVDAGKANLSAPGKHTIFLKKVSVTLPNSSETHVKDDADEIGGLEVADFSEVLHETKMREQAIHDRLRETVAECMTAIPAGGEIDMTTLVSMIMAKAPQYGKKTFLREELLIAIPPAHQGGIQIKDHRYDIRRSGVHKTATIYVCKREIDAG